ncbi:DNA polymerase I [Caldalkalibacillus salinus]|uniref:DNA polymerase I n=1 Tax=Caldalkalibacillus salinus TaxID=2803787 RepID=UPI001923D1EE|nr:DNA polymerase I [Caldalkalibacillus salinus]
MSNNKLILIDGNSIASRAFYALPLLSSEKGVYTNAVYGFTTMLLRILEEEKPTHILVAFDAGKVTFRHTDYKAYKGKRQKSPNELSEQFPIIRELLDAFSIERYELEGYEADDIIGTLTKQADTQGLTTKVFTGDKDMLQLVSEHTHVALTRKGISEVEYYDLEALYNKYELKPNQIVDLKGLMGDASDNIPGVPGVGEKTALKLLHQFETVENVYEHLDGVSGKKLKENLTNHKDDAFMSKDLATILREAPLEVNIEQAKYDGYDVEKVVPLFKELEFNSILERVGGTVEEEEDLEEYDIITITEQEQDQLDNALVSPAALHVEIWDDQYHQAPIYGYAIRNEKGHFYLTPEVVNNPTFKAWLENPDQEKWVYHAKRTQVALKWKNIDLQGVTFDPFLASYLLNPSDSGYNIQTIAKAYGNITINSDEQFYGKGAKRQQPEQGDTLTQHVSNKAEAVYRAKDHLAAKLEEHELSSLLKDLELPLSQVLGQMEYEGISVDIDTLHQMETELQERLEGLTKEIYDLAGTTFNINSPKQLGEVLFEKLNLPVIKKTKTGYSTNADVLEKLEPQHEIVGKILHYRQLGKLHSTYIEGLLKVVHEDTKKVHTNFQQTIAATGRLSSTDPNLQNIPIRLEEGRKIRKAFVPTRDNAVILAADYSQIELRVLAHICGDNELIKAFNEEMDIHTKTAVDVFHVSEDEVTSLMRRTAKAVNFGIVYGISDYGLSQNLNITRKEAGQFIDRYFESYPGVKQFMEDVVQQAKKDGYVTTLLHRRRYLPEINNRNFNRRSFAERTAMNTPIQGTAADIIKKAMVHMDQQLKENNLKSKLLLQVHDELIFDVPKEEEEQMKALVTEVMESAMSLSVPLKVDVSVGNTWYDAK